MTCSEDLRRLHFINALFAGLTGHDLYLAQQILSAITTSLADAESRPPSAPAPACNWKCLRTTPSRCAR